MPKNVSKSAILDACVEGATSAADKYLSWSGGRSIRAAPESLVQTFVAMKLAELVPLVTLEERVSSILKEAGAPTPERHTQGELGRVDIALWHKSGKPRIVVEIKRLSSSTSINKDVERMNKLIYLCPSLQAGIVVAVTHADEQETIDRRFKIAAKNSHTKAARVVGGISGKSLRNKEVQVGIACFFTKGQWRA